MQFPFKLFERGLGSIASAGLRVARSPLRKLQARLRTRFASPRTAIARLGAIVAAVTVVAPPVFYAWISFNQLQQRADEQASLGARHLEAQMARGEKAIDWMTQISINVVVATQRADSPLVASWVTDATGGTLMFHGRSPWWPELNAYSKIDSPAFQGHFHVALSTRTVFLGTLGVGVAFMILGLGAFYCFQRLPLSALDRALQKLETKKQELTEQKAQLEVQNLRFDAALNNMSQGLCMFDENTDLVVCNSAYARLYSLPPELTQPGTPFRRIVEHRTANGMHVDQSAEEHVREVLNSTADGHPLTRMRELADGRVIVIKQHPMADGGWLSTHEDVTEYRRIEARMAHMSRHDTLTDLPNRGSLRARLEEALVRANEGESVAVINLDLDSFKEINDTLGHHAGDILLRQVAERLRSCAGDVDTIARPVGDEFSIVQIAQDQPLAATSLATRIIESLDAPFNYEGQQVILGGSLGIAISPGDGNEADVLLRNADIALHRAKAEGRGTYRFFEAGMDADMQARRQLQVDLRAALSNGEFELFYQPVVNLECNEISGFEALLRWHHPVRGSISPAQFIPVAEETGLIVSIGEWALRQACAQAAVWPSHIKVAVNLSPVQFRAQNLVQMVFAALASSGLAAQRLELEITESVLLQDNAATLATLHQLRSLGVRIAMDDFGTGYSSLSYLRSFPFDKIKIDRRFVSDLSDTAEGSRAILRAVANLGHDLGMTTTAEGVETEEQVSKVRAEGCTEMQGYFFSPPRPMRDIERLFLASCERGASAA
jgi:diguanylate cyclase (GGDEF)-like protein